MIFEPGDVRGMDRHCWRYSAWEEAEAGHARIAGEALAAIFAPDPKVE
jgi:hypothetical protein